MWGTCIIMINVYNYAFDRTSDSVESCRENITHKLMNFLIEMFFIIKFKG